MTSSAGSAFESVPVKASGSGPSRCAKAHALRQDRGETACTAQPGDLLIMRPLLLHASSKASRPQGRRRVLHFLFGPSDPGHGLRWSLAI